jgi:FKBP-type peptidyl-prolyl cis-trans isomerase
MKQLLSLITLAGVLALSAACSGNNNSPSSTDTGVSSFTTLQIANPVVGTGAEAVNGRLVTVHYTGWLYSATAAGNKGTKFDSSRDRNQPFQFTLGVGQVIQGWDQGVAGMRVGGQRTLIIPPGLAYGSRGSGSAIPPNATLVFDVELLAVN